MQQIPQRLQWACRRGMLELDILLQRYLTKRYPSATLDEQHCFEQLLTCTDPDLFDWLMQKKTPSESHYQELVQKILST